MLRTEKGWSQEELGYQSAGPGRPPVHRNYVSGAERGTLNPTLLMIFRLAHGLGVKPSELIALAEQHLDRGV